MNKISFDRLIKIFVGSFIAIIIFTVFFIKYTSKTKIDMVDNHQILNFQENTNDIFAEKIENIESDYRSVVKNIQDMNQLIQKENQNIVEQMKEMNVRINTLGQNIITIESNYRTTRVQIIKPEYRLRRLSSTRQNEEDEAMILSTSKVLAVVGKRAWMNFDENEDSIMIGKELPKTNPLIKANPIHDESVIIVTSAEP